MSWFLRRSVRRWVSVSGSLWFVFVFGVGFLERLLVVVCCGQLCGVNNIFKLNVFIFWLDVPLQL